MAGKRDFPMSARIVLRLDFDALQLRKLAKGCSDTRQTRRLLALGAIYDGMSRADAAKIGGMDRQTLRDWVYRFNEEGSDGLTNRKGQARRRRLSDTQGPSGHRNRIIRSSDGGGENSVPSMMVRVYDFQKLEIIPTVDIIWDVSV